MSIFQEKTTVIRLEQLSDENYFLELHAPQVANTGQPGQFIMLEVSKGSDPLLRRPFSLNRLADDGSIRILFKVVGRGTEILSHSVKGDILPILGPLGHGFEIDTNRPACLVGGGMGIAPMLFLAEKLSKIEGRQMEDIIILGGRNRRELEPLVGDFDRLGMKLLLATDDGSMGVDGLVTDVLAGEGLSSDYILYSCGPKPMLAAVYKELGDSGVSCQVSIESVMACGMGACLGCSVGARDEGYVHVCTDGPVFKAEELEW